MRRGVTAWRDDTTFFCCGEDRVCAATVDGDVLGAFRFSRPFGVVRTAGLDVNERRCRLLLLSFQVFRLIFSRDVVGVSLFPVAARASHATHRGTKKKGDCHYPVATRKEHHGHVSHQRTTAREASSGTGQAL